jgi:hypothetical protein
MHHVDSSKNKKTKVIEHELNGYTDCSDYLFGTDNPSGAHELTPCFSEVGVAQSLVFCAFCRSLLLFFALFLLAIVRPGIGKKDKLKIQTR